MLNKEWKKLQNGSDIRGYAIETEGGQSVNLTDEAVEAIAASFGMWLSRKKEIPVTGLRVSVGTDSRLSAPRLKAAVIRGLTFVGCTVFDCNMASTPAMFMSTVIKGREYDGSIMITASHLPFNRNGLKFFIPEGGLEKQDIGEVLELAQEKEYKTAFITGTVVTVDLISIYAAGLVWLIQEGVNHPEHFDQPLKGFKILVDAGNGGGGFFAQKVLAPLGADITGSQFLEPDGSFPNHMPNPEDEAAMESVTRAVLENHADLGIIFDTDVDRAGAVASNGKEINKNKLIALMSSIVLEKYPHSTIVTDSITSSGLKSFIEDKLGGIHHRFKRGYKNVINESIRLNQQGKESHLAIETSGHGALKENFFLDDGAYLMTKLIIKMAKLKLEGNKTIDSLIAELAEPVEGKEFRMNIQIENFRDYGTRIIEELTAYAGNQPGWNIAPDNYEGIRVSFGKEEGDGWFLLRLSLHDPLIPLNIESDSIGGVVIIAKKLYAFLKGYTGLDITPLHTYIG